MPWQKVHDAGGFPFELFRSAFVRTFVQDRTITSNEINVQIAFGERVYKPRVRQVYSRLRLFFHMSADDTLHGCIVRHDM